MNPEKVGKFIKKIRKDNNLTQKDLADKYGVTYQAVSKWENGINLPEITLLRQISKDFNVSIEDILDGEVSKKKKNITIYIVVLLSILAIIVLIFAFKNNNKNNFDFKTISASCEEFKVTGSIAYNKDKSSIYISDINYCGKDDDTLYKEVECNLYEKNDNTNMKISSCKSMNNIKLDEYLKDIELNIDNYSRMCKKYTNDSLYLEVNAIDKNNKITTYKIPLNINDNCAK